MKEKKNPNPKLISNRISKTPLEEPTPFPQDINYNPIRTRTPLFLTEILPLFKAIYTYFGPREKIILGTALFWHSNKLDKCLNFPFAAPGHLRPCQWDVPAAGLLQAPSCGQGCAFPWEFPLWASHLPPCRCAPPGLCFLTGSYHPVGLHSSIFIDFAGGFATKSKSCLAGPFPRQRYGAVSFVAPR